MDNGHWLDCAYAYADFSRRWAHMPVGAFLQIEAYILYQEISSIYFDITYLGLY